MLAPCFSLPTIASVLPQRFVSVVSGNGSYMSTFVPGAKIVPKSNDAGSTPTMVTGPPSNFSTLPTMFGSAANFRLQRPSLSIAARGPFQTHSSALNCRPTCGSTPSSGKKFCVTGTLVSRSGCPSPINFASPGP